MEAPEKARQLQKNSPTAHSGSAASSNAPVPCSRPSPQKTYPGRSSLRQGRLLADQAFDLLNPNFFRLYPEGGRPSIPPEQLLLALLLEAIYGIHCERMLVAQLDYNLLFRWFVGLNPDDPVWHHTSFTRNCDRLLNEELKDRLLEMLMASPEVRP